jgi:hypothetical protein
MNIDGEGSHVMQSFSQKGLILMKGGHANFFVSRYIANPQILGLIPQLQIVNPQICKEKNNISDSDLHWFASLFSYTKNKYILDYEMPCYTVPKAKSRHYI